ncbi:uncharacterized protein LOC130441210 isoform X1 [Diorhabda sublineata]|uniref:uncharacterized protein LOC130441210 isoform X1 n=1 Tax=Diorhabda sublineata TaxID=1163346 RepID=UPI0024E15DF2|nr:uncharacterized protein LOC130441210 isoform X1 [Diorhabda sublineata]
MDRLKSKLSKILYTVDFIADEKLSIEENLNQILNQVFAKVNHLKGNRENLKHRHVSHVQRYILQVYQQFCEINSILDVLLEENIVKTLDVSTVNNDLDSSKKTPTELLSFGQELAETYETEQEDKNYEKQNLKQSSYDFRQTFLNKQNLSDIKDYYEKASTGFQTVTTTSTPMPGSSFSHTNQCLQRDFEVPEKDSNAEYKQLKEVDSEHELIEHIENKEQLTDSISSRSVIDNKIDTSIENESKYLHNYTALDKLNNFKSKVDENPGLFDLSEDFTLKPSGTGTTIHNFILRAQENVIKDSKKQKNVKYEIKFKETPKVGEYCIVSHIESPDEFYIHVDIMSVEKIATDVNNYCQQVETVNYASKQEALDKVGRFCFALIENESWYRVEILKIEENEDVLVRLVDYGNKELVSYKNLLNLTEELSSVPMLAIWCHFPLLYPPGSTRLHKLTSWPITSIEAMNSFCEGICFTIVYASRESNNSVAIDFSCEDIEDTIGQLLMDGNYAVQIVEGYLDNENDVELDRFLHDIDTVEPDNINEAVLGYDPRDEARICRFTKPDGTCYKGKHCKLEHFFLPKDGFTTDKENIFSEAMYSLILPPINSTIMILITSYIDTCRFYGQIINNPHKKGKYSLDYDMNLLLKEMNSPQIIKTYESYKIAPAIGEIVIVKCKKWLRAIVREVRIHETGIAAEVKLFIVDTGDNITASIEAVRKIKPHFLQLPFQVVEFYIYNYQMSKNSSAHDVRKFFNENLYLHNFLATTKSSNAPLKVELKNLNGRMVIGSTLEKEGYAERRTIDIHVSETCNLDLG